MKIKVLLVDDHAVLREGITMLLVREKDIAVVGECSTGQESIDAYRILKPDVVVMDIGLPDIDGIVASKRIIKADSKAKIIILSMYSAKEQIVSALNAGVRGYVCKENTSRELINAIRSVHDGNQYFDKIVFGILSGDAAFNKQTEQLDSDKLTNRQAEVLCLIAEGKSTRVIAGEIGISVDTVATHKRLLMEKLKIYDPVGLAQYAHKHGLITTFV